MFADQRPQIVVVHQLRVNVPLARSLLLSCSSSNLYNLSPCFSFCLSPKQGTYTPPLCTRACARTCIWCAPYVRFSHTTVVFTPSRNTFTRVGWGVCSYHDPIGEAVSTTSSPRCCRRQDIARTHIKLTSNTRESRLLLSQSFYCCCSSWYHMCFAY